MHNLWRRSLAGLLVLCMMSSLTACNGNNGNSGNNGERENAGTSVEKPAVETSMQPKTAVEAEINVEAVPGLSEDFLMGWDISTLTAEYASGVKFYDYEGNELAAMADFCQFAADCGITHARIRIWNDPYDAKGHGYGGGNCDIANAVAIADACKEAGLKVLLDFHGSDFWADPVRQLAPKAWKNYSVDQKCTALAEFITDALEQVSATGVDIDMVQVGNETNYGFAGEDDISNMVKLFAAGSDAVRAFDSDIQILLHFTDPQKGTMTDWAPRLEENVDYDILATSYYPFWHGSLSDLSGLLQDAAAASGKPVLVVESYYPYSTVNSDSGGTREYIGDLEWPINEQGQATYVRDLIDAANKGGSIGVFYWEPAWITVGDTTGLEGDELEAQLAKNNDIWEEFGSGWASSYAGKYDAEADGTYGGSDVETMAFFDAAGHPLPSLGVWKYVYTGAVTDREWDDTLPETSASTGDSYTAAEGNLIPADAASFKSGDDFVIDGAAISSIPAGDDPYDDEGSMHWWSESEVVTNSVTYTKLITLTKGKYKFSAYAQGMSGDKVTLQVLDADGKELFTGKSVTLADWINWKQPTVKFSLKKDTDVTLRVIVDIQTGGWGTVDCLELVEK